MKKHRRIKCKRWRNGVKSNISDKNNLLTSFGREYSSFPFTKVYGGTDNVMRSK